MVAFRIYADSDDEPSPNQCSPSPATLPAGLNRSPIVLLNRLVSELAGSYGKPASFLMGHKRLEEQHTRFDIHIDGLIIECKAVECYDRRRRPLINAVRRLWRAEKDILILGVENDGTISGFEAPLPHDRDSIRLMIDTALSSLQVLPESYECRLVSVGNDHLVPVIARRQRVFFRIYDSSITPPPAMFSGIDSVRLGTRLLIEETRSTELKALEYITDCSVYLLLRYINSFLNSSGGTLIAGVNDDGVVVGSSLWLRRLCGDDEEQTFALERVIRNAIMSQFEPPPPSTSIQFEWLPVNGTVSERWVLAVRVARGASPVTIWCDDCEGDLLYLRREASVSTADYRAVLQLRQPFPAKWSDGSDASNTDEETYGWWMTPALSPQLTAFTSVGDDTDAIPELDLDVDI